mgnify:CR=1 FL=1
MVSRVAIAALMISASVGIGGCAVFGSSTANTASTSSADSGPEETGSLGVNAYLWRATLDTLNFLPLASADPYGGVVITDWYANPAKADERLKATVYILDTRLRQLQPAGGRAPALVSVGALSVGIELQPLLRWRLPHRFNDIEPSPTVWRGAATN